MSEMVDRVQEVLLKSLAARGMLMMSPQFVVVRGQDIVIDCASLARAVTKAIREPSEAQRKCPHARKQLHHDTQTGNYHRCLDCQLEWGEFEQLSDAALKD